MAVTPTQTPVSTTVPTLTLAAGTTGGVAVANSIDPVNDYALIYTASATATQGINRNTFLGLSSAPVGLSDTQTLTNKIITAPTISSPTLSGTLTGSYTLGGTPTFPSSVVLLTGTQSITGSKTFTAATLTAPTITNATISADALTGFTTSNSGVFYGISVTTGVIQTPNSILGAALTNSSVTPSKLATGSQNASVVTSETTTSTSYTDLATTTDTVTVTIGVNGLALVILTAAIANSGANYSNMSFLVSGANTQAASDIFAVGNNGSVFVTSSSVFLLSGLTAGSTTFKAKYDVSAGTGTYKNRRIAVVPL